ncbi:furin-like [Clytia hemisphaerica]|uniref:P/Homo B domain-containing protein n=1 Tax=Clytia hemisphaerica TaxID=252671 RepID=A0A7M5VAS4_9CNID
MNLKFIGIDLTFLFMILYSTAKSVNGSEESQIYTDFLALKVQGGHENARQIAQDSGLYYHGQVGSLDDWYIFKQVPPTEGQHRRVRRSILNEIVGKLSSFKNVDFVDSQILLKRSRRDLVFDDPLYSHQWNLHGKYSSTDTCTYNINVTTLWRQNITGKNVVVTVVDDGVEHRHKDIVGNYDADASFDYNSNDKDPTPRPTSNNINKHGTRCAGQIAGSANNSVCGIGVAYNAKIGGIRMFDGPYVDSIEAASFSFKPQHIDIYSVSWGPDDNGRTVDGPRHLATKAIKNGIESGRGGLGSIYVFATGNGGKNKDHCGCDGFVSMVETMAISSVDYCGNIPFYAERCTGIMAVTYSSGSNPDKKITTIDLGGKCTNYFTGTSASAPVAAGIFALALEVNSNLTWRDMQQLVVHSSDKIKPRFQTWITNGAGHRVSEYFGFGSLNAGRLVEMAKNPNWKTLAQQRICKSNNFGQNQDIIRSSTLILKYNTTACSESSSYISKLEHVKIYVTLDSLPRGGLEISVQSPSGTIAPILRPRGKDLYASSFDNWGFLSVFFWDEDPVGEWTINIRQTSSRARTGKLSSVYLEWYGTVGNSTGTYTPKPEGSTTTPTKATPVIAPTSGNGFHFSTELILTIVFASLIVLAVVAGVIYKYLKGRSRRRRNGQVVAVMNNNGPVRRTFSNTSYIDDLSFTVTQSPPLSPTMTFSHHQPVFVEETDSRK